MKVSATCHRPQGKVGLRPRALPSRVLAVKCDARQEPWSTTESKKQFSFPSIVKQSIAASVLAGTLILSGAAHADMIQTVPKGSITDYAKTLQKSNVDKRQIWIVFVGGAAVLFGATLVAENISGWFPAIAKANKAMSMYKNLPEEPEDSVTFDPPTQAEPKRQVMSDEDRQVALMNEDLRALARQKAPPSTPAASETPAPPPPTSYPQELSTSMESEAPTTMPAAQTMPEAAPTPEVVAPSTPSPTESAAAAPATPRPAASALSDDELERELMARQSRLQDFAARMSDSKDMMKGSSPQ